MPGKGSGGVGEARVDRGASSRWHQLHEAPTMSGQLNLSVSDEFAKKLERVVRSTGLPMAAVLESVGTPALDAAEADARFEAEALAAWEE